MGWKQKYTLVHSSQYLFAENRTDFLFSLKPIFYLILYLSSVFSNLFSVFPMTGARFLFALNGLLILVLMYLYIKKKTNRYNAVLAVLILAGTNIFLDRGFRVRSDLLLSSFSLIILLLTLNIKKKKDDLKFYIIIPLLLSLLLISPKGIYWFFFILCLLLYDLKNNMPSLWLVVKTVFLVYMVYYFLSFLLKDPLFLNAIHNSLMFYFSDFKETWLLIFHQGLIKALFDFSHIGLFTKRNLFLILIISVKLFFITYSIFITKKRKWDSSDLYFFLFVDCSIISPTAKNVFFCVPLCPLSLFLFLQTGNGNNC